MQPLSPCHLTYLFLAAALILAGCRKEVRFTDDPSATLDFSRDTVMFDTIFTTVGSITKRFTVRNPGSNGVRVDIALVGGSTSPFRLNVDGASGLAFSQVEIYGGDSIYVFVEATLGPGGVNTPFIIEDHIRFITNGNEQEVLLVAWGQDAYFHYPDQFVQGFPPFSYAVGGLDENGVQICGETRVWASDKPHVIYGYAVVDGFNGEGVPCGNHLIIEAGARIYVHGGGGLWIFRNGQVTAVGTLDAPITFQSDRREPLYQDLPGQWDRIWINEGPEGADNRFEHVIIRNALIGIQCETWPLSPSLPTSANTLILDNVRILNSSAAGILSRNYRIHSNNLLVADAGQYCVALTGGGEYFFNHSTIANYWSLSIRQTPAFFLSNAYQDINGTVQVRPIEQSFFQNGIIYGNNGNEFLMQLDNGAPADILFRYMLFRTDQSTNGPMFQDGSIWRNNGPGFVSATERDLRLTSTAFARNKGFPSTFEAITDILGQTRNCDVDGIDLGCFEYCP